MAYETLHERLGGPIKTSLKKELNISNDHALPRIEKVVVSVGINKSKMDSKDVHAYIAESLAQITGQKPVFTKARKAISNFKTRQDMVVGAMVTLRGRRMEDFLDRLISYTLPRIRDFRGLKPKLDGQGNYSIGLKDHSIFVEIPPADAKQLFGMQIQVKTTTQSNDEALALLTQIGFPFIKKSQPSQVEQEKAKQAEAKKEAEEAAMPAQEESKNEKAPAEDKPATEAAEERAEESETDTAK